MATSVCTTATAAIREIERRAFALMIVDLALERGADGLPVLDRARALQPAAPVIVHSGHRTAFGAKVAGRGVPFHDKPMPEEELRRVLLSAVEEWLLAKGRVVDLVHAIAEASGVAPMPRVVLFHLMRGRGGDEIALLLGVTAETVRSHVAALYERLAVHSIDQLILRTVAPVLRRA